MPSTAHIALGGNLGEPADTLMRALEMLQHRFGIEVIRVSQFYRTAPVGGPADQPDYLNAAAELRTTLTPQALLTTLQEVETACGRNRTNEQRWGPRTCDLDLLLIGETVLETDTLILPHPRMCDRAFVLQPLSEIAPDAVHPLRKRSIRELWDNLEKHPS